MAFEWKEIITPVATLTAVWPGARFMILPSNSGLSASAILPVIAQCKFIGTILYL